MEYLWIALLCLFGSFVQGTTGFGFSMITMSVFSAFLPYQTAQILGLITCGPMFIYIALRNIKKVNFKLIVIPMISAIITIVCVVTLVHSFDDSLLRKILGVILILLSIYFIFFSNKLKLKKNIPTQIIVGSVSGALGGLCNMGGPPAVIYLLNVSEDSVEYNSSLQFFFISTFSVNLALHLLQGSFTPDVLPLLPYSLSGMAVGTIVGTALSKKIDFNFLKKIVYVLIAGIGVFLIVMS